MTFILGAAFATPVEACPVCGGHRFTRDERRGEEVCATCGYVRDLAPVRDRPPAQATARGKAPRRLPRRLEALQRQGEAGHEHRMRLAQEEVRRLASALGCPADVGERASRMLEQARKARITQGRPLDAAAPAALLASCRILLLARTEEEVAAVAKVPWPQIQAAYKALVRGLRLKVPALTAQQFLGQLAARVGLDDKVQAEAYRLLQPVCGTSAAAGKSPLGWGAAALLLAARSRGQAPSVAEMARAAGVSPSTLLARVKDLAGLEPAT